MGTAGLERATARAGQSVRSLSRSHCPQSVPLCPVPMPAFSARAHCPVQPVFPVFKTEPLTARPAVPTSRGELLERQADDVWVLDGLGAALPVGDRLGVYA